MGLNATMSTIKDIPATIMEPGIIYTAGKIHYVSWWVFTTTVLQQIVSSVYFVVQINKYSIDCYEKV